MVPASCSRRDALLLAGDDEAREHGQHRAVHRHRHRHLVERDAVEEDLHVLDRVDRDAGLADVADDARVVAVVAAVRREVERDRQAHLPGGEVLAVEGVRLLGGREARVLADRPRPVRVHRRPRAPHERLEAGQPADGLEPLEVGRRVQRLHRDPLGRLPHERPGIGAPQLLRRQLAPSPESLVGMRGASHALRALAHAGIVLRASWLGTSGAGGEQLLALALAFL